MIVPPGTLASAAASTLLFVAPVKGVSPTAAPRCCWVPVVELEPDVPAAPAVAAPDRPAAAVAATTAMVRVGGFRGIGSFLALRWMQCRFGRAAETKASGA